VFRGDYRGFRDDYRVFRGDYRVFRGDNRVISYANKEHHHGITVMVIIQCLEVTIEGLEVFMESLG